MPTATLVPEITRQLSDAYTKAQTELSREPDMAAQVWDDTLTKLQGIDFSQPSRSEFFEAHAAVSVLEQVLVAVTARTGGFNGEQDRS